MYEILDWISYLGGLAIGFSMIFVAIYNIVKWLVKGENEDS